MNTQKPTVEPRRFSENPTGRAQVQQQHRVGPDNRGGETPTPTTRLMSGLAGAAVLTVLNEGARRLSPSAPRLDVLGMRGVIKLFQLFGASPPTGRRLRTVTLLGDLLTNTLYYSRVPGLRNTSRLRALVLGSGAGIAAQILSPVLGLGKKPIARQKTTRLMTVAWYLIGGLAAAWAARKPHSSTRHSSPEHTRKTA